MKTPLLNLQINQLLPTFYQLVYLQLTFEFIVLHMQQQCACVRATCCSYFDKHLFDQIHYNEKFSESTFERKTIMILHVEIFDT